MTRADALALDQPLPRLNSRCATGTDGERWFRTHSMGQQEWTQELFRTSWGICGRDHAELDPEGVDWAPGYHDPDREMLAPYPEGARGAGESAASGRCSG